MPTISTLTVDVTSRTSRFASGMKLAVGGLAALAAGAAYAFGQFEESEKIQNQTAAALKSTGHAARISGSDISDMAARLAALTGIDDEVIQSGENMLLTFTNIKNVVGGEFTGTFDRATGTILDMSVALGQDLNSSAIQLGKALNDPIAGITALQRVGVSFSEQTKKQIALLVKHGEITKAQGIILDELGKEFGGSAEAQATASGKMSVAWGNLAETIGGVVAPVFTWLATHLQTIAEFLMTNVPEAIRATKHAFNDVMDAVTPFVDLVVDKMTPAIEGAVEWFQKVFQEVKPLAIALGKELFEAATQVWQVVEQNLWPILKDLWNVLQKLWEVVGPLVKVWLTIQALWIKLALEILPPVLAVIADLIEIVLDVVDAFLTVVNWVRDRWVEPIIRWIQKVADFISDKFVGAWQAALGPISAVIGKIIDWIETLVGWIQKAVEWLGKLVGEGPVPGTIPGRIYAPPPGGDFQHGGVVSKTGMAMVHAGEVFSGVNNEMGFGGFNGDITLVLDGKVLAKVTRDELLKLGNRNAGTGIR
jgi:hypothetical protein